MPGLLQLREQLQGWPAVWIVAIDQNFAQHRFSLGKFSVSNILFRNLDAALAETSQRFIVRFGRSDRVGEQI